MLFEPTASAQIRSATITGSVVDQSGAAVPNAEAVITNTGTNVSYKTKTTESGRFSMPYLEAGTYSVEVLAPGFVPYRETGLIVSTGQTARVNANLHVGAVESVVEVMAQAAQIQTDSSVVSTLLVPPSSTQCPM